MGLSNLPPGVTHKMVDELCQDDRCAEEECMEKATVGCDPCGREFCAEHCTGPTIAYGMETWACDECRQVGS